MNKQSTMKIEDLKPGDRLWVECPCCGSGHIAKYVDEKTSTVELPIETKCTSIWSAKIYKTLWEKVVDLFFKRK